MSPHHPHDVGDRNVERLLDCAYRPESPDPAFVRRVTARLHATARDLATARQGTAPPRPSLRRTWAIAAVAALVLLVLGLHALLEPAGRRPRGPGEMIQGLGSPLPNSLVMQLTPRPRPPSPPVKPVEVGATVQTAAGERRRITLGDGSVLYLNESTRVQVMAERQVKLAAGEVFVEVSPREPDTAGATFRLTAANREVTALGTKFAVRAAETGPGVVVTQGKVRVSGVEDVVRAGQELAPGTDHPAAAPRASHVLDWTRELMIAAESPLVPQSKYCGGALVVVDPNGQEASLSLRRYHVDVHIEDGFARTTIDQTYFNHEARRLEGTFYFPLPADASLSRLAMYVDGNLMEGGMAERGYARQVFESIVRRQRDPALLEWVDGTTFKMRVFPLEGRQEKRIVLSYTQRLSSLYGHSNYRFPAGHNLDMVRDWSCHVRVKDGAGLAWKCPSHQLESKKEGKDLLLDAAAHEVKVDRDLVLELTDSSPPKGEGRKEARFSSAEHESSRYLMLRYRPTLPGKAKRQRRDWVVLFESSGDRDPLLARVQVDVIRTLLNNAEHDDTFAIVTAGARTQTYSDKPQPATPENVKAAIEYLDQTHLVGGLDLGEALTAAEPFLKAGDNPYLVHVGSGHAVLGERRADVLAKRVPEGTRYVGIAVGKRWSRPFMKTAAERSGGYFTQINPDESVSWRAFELFATLSTPRLLNIQVVDDAEKATFLPDATMLSQGEELCAIARIDGDKQPLPRSVSVSGTLDGKPFRQVLEVKDVAAQANYLPRTWAKLEIDRLLTDDTEKNKARIIDLSKAMYVMTPFTSLLVLENEAMYAQFQVDRGRKDHWAMYPCPQKIPVVSEPLGVAQAGSASADDVLKTILVRVPPRVLTSPGQADVTAGWRATTAWELQRVRGYAMPVLSTADYEFKEILGEVEKTRTGLFLRNQGGQLNNFGLPGRADPSQAIGIPRGLGGRSPYLNIYNGGMPTQLNYYPLLLSEDMQRITLLRGRPGPAAGSGGASAPGFFPGQVSAFSDDGRRVAGGWWYVGQANQGLGGGGGMAPLGYIPPQPTTYYWNGALHYSSFGGGFGSGGFGGSPFGAMVPGGFSTAWPGVTSTNGTANINLLVLPSQINGDMQRGGEQFEGLDLYGLYPPAMGLAGTDKSRIYAGRLPGQVAPFLTAPYTVAFSPDGKKLITQQLEEQAVRLWDLSTGAVLMPALGNGAKPRLPRYERPAYTRDERIFQDLLAYAPGLSTSAADIQAVLEAEAAADPASAPGTIDPAARALIERARAGGWQTIILPGKPGFTLVCDGQGRHACEHTLPAGLVERIVCDGTTLLHLYPELGLGARRTMSRFHRAELGDVVPWFVPPAEDLARGADVQAVDEHTVAIVPAGVGAKAIPYVRVHLLFADDGRLAERQVVQMPEKKVLSRETYAADGTVQVRNAEDKVVATRKFTVKAASAPDLTPDTTQLVVLPLPLRTRDHVLATDPVEMPPNGRHDGLKAVTALALIECDVAAGSESARDIIAQRFRDHGDHRLGFATLWAASGSALTALPVSDQGEPKALRRYLTWLKGGCSPLSADARADLGDGLLQRLVAFHELIHRGEARLQTPLSTEERNRLVDFLRDARSPTLVWAAVDQVLQGKPFMALPGEEAELKRLVLETARQSLADVPGLNYAARYEQARLCLATGDRAQARQWFRDLYARAEQDGVLLTLDADFRKVLHGDGKETDLWGPLMLDTAERLLTEHRYLAVLALARQCLAAEDQRLADELVTRVVARAGVGADRLPVALGALDYYWATEQVEPAQRLLRSLLAEPAYAEWAPLWRFGAKLAAERHQTTEMFTCLERALGLEFPRLPEVIDVSDVRRDYGQLLEHYRQRAEALTVLQEQPPKDFLKRVVSVADRWRALDNDGTAACQTAARIFQQLGHPDMAWDYLSTPLQARTEEPAAALELARALGKENKWDLAELAFRHAAAAEPENAQVLWERAQNLVQSGRHHEARRLLRQLAEGTWPEQYRNVQEQARQQLPR